MPDVSLRSIEPLIVIGLSRVCGSDPPPTPLSLPSLGVSSLDLGRLWQRKRPFFLAPMERHDVVFDERTLPDDRGSRSSGFHFQHQHLRGPCFGRVSDALMGIFMGRTEAERGSARACSGAPPSRSHRAPPLCTMWYII